MWQSKGNKGTIKINSNPKKKRINILGAFDFKNFELITTLTETKCNKELIVDFFHKMRGKYSNEELVIILDNAAYNHANYTREYAKWYNIKLLFLPPYSPNLNLIERLWKFVKKKLVHNIYYNKFEDFLNKVHSFFEKIDEWELELRKILTKKFGIL
jgi:transposase